MSSHSTGQNLWEDNELYRNAVRQIEHAARTMNLDLNILQRMRRPKRAIVVSVPVRMDNGEVQVFEGYRVHHSMTLGPAKGGIRYHQDVTLGEVGALAMLMSMKCSLVGLPLGGGKGGIRVDSSKLSRTEAQALTRRYTMEIINWIGPEKDVPAPDVGTDGQHMAWLMDTYSAAVGHTVPSVVTGKPVELGGSLGRAESTGRGVVFAFEHAVKYLKNKGRAAPSMDNSTTAAIHGFGKVGNVAAMELFKRGVKVQAVSDVSGALYNKNGLNIPELMEWIQEKKVLKGYKEADMISNEELLTLDVDLLSPSAIENVITEKNAHKVRAKIISEGANGPITNNASNILEDKGIFILPDIFANSGGVIVSYFEWVQGLQSFFWSEDEVNSRLGHVMDRAFQKMVAQDEMYKCGMRTAAMISAVDRLTKAQLLRGLFP